MTDHPGGAIPNIRTGGLAIASVLRQRWLTVAQVIGLASVGSLLVVPLLPYLTPGAVRSVASAPRMANAAVLPPSPKAPPSPPVAPEMPVSIVIRSIDVSAPIETVGSTNGQMDAPEGDTAKTTVGYWTGSPMPGSGQGDSVFNGQTDLSDSQSWVLNGLKDVKPGDAIVVQTADSAIVYGVTASFESDPTTPPPGMLSNTGPPRLTIYTCAGTFVTPTSGSARWIVEAVRS